MSKFNSAINSILIGLLCLLAGCSQKNGPKIASETFISHLQRGETTVAYESASLAFQTQLLLRDFDVNVKELNLKNYPTLHWTSEQIQENEAKFEGELIPKEGNNLIVIASFIKESGEWKVYKLRIRSTKGATPEEYKFTQIGQSADFNQISQPNIPPEKQIKELVRETLIKFNEAIQQEDFDDFYNSIAVGWQKEISQPQMMHAFQGFIDKKIDITPIFASVIMFDEPPALNGIGCLVTKAHCKTPAYLVSFTLTYKYELPNWKLNGIVIHCTD